MRSDVSGLAGLAPSLPRGYRPTSRWTCLSQFAWTTPIGCSSVSAHRAIGLGASRAARAVQEARPAEPGAVRGTNASSSSRTPSSNPSPVTWVTSDLGHLALHLVGMLPVGSDRRAGRELGLQRRWDRAETLGISRCMGCLGNLRDPFQIERVHRPAVSEEFTSVFKSNKIEGFRFIGEPLSFFRPLTLISQRN